ncbi:MAG TPA: hypothetical protein VGZ47_05865 [Gemmataceae bacterium]|jgi:hypothetical protein|nr:hypothetical protein [Gemmataceae bacterium]
MVRILRIWPSLLAVAATWIGAGDLQAKPPELPMRPDVECLIPAPFDLPGANVPFLLTPQQAPAEVSKAEMLCMPPEIEQLNVYPQEIAVFPATLRMPDLPAVDSRIVLALERIEGEVEVYESVDYWIRRMVARFGYDSQFHLVLRPRYD